MSDHKSKHPLFLIIAYLAIAGGLSVLLMSLYLLTSTIEKQRWPVTDITPAQSGLFYQVGEKRYVIQKADLRRNHAINKVYYNPDRPEQYLTALPSYWWHLYLCMAGLIVLYAGLHLLRERECNVQSLGFE